VRLEARQVAPDGTPGPIHVLAGGDPSPCGQRVAGDGTVTIAWVRSDGGRARLEARQLRAGGELGPVRTLAGPAREISCRSLPAGTGAVVWERMEDGKNVGEARTLAPDGTLGPTATLYAAPGDARTLARLHGVWPGAGGVSAVTWLDGGLRARILSAAGEPGPSLAVADVEFGGPGEIAVAAGADGGAAFAWKAKGSGILRARRVAPDGSMTAPSALTDTAGASVRVVLDEHGTATLAWWENAQQREGVFARRMGLDGTLGATLPITASAASLAELSAAPSGAVTVLFGARTDTVADPGVQLRRILPDGTMAAPQTVVAANLSSIRSLAAAGDGALMLAARRYKLVGNKYGVNEEDVDTSFHRIAADGTISDLTAPPGVVSAGVAVGPGGQATAIWRCGFVDSWIVLAREFPQGPGAATACDARAHDAIPPELTRLRATRRVHARAARPRIVEHGSATLRFRLSEPAALRIVLERRAAGRRPLAGRRDVAVLSLGCQPCSRPRALHRQGRARRPRAPRALPRDRPRERRGRQPLAPRARDVSRRASLSDARMLRAGDLPSAVSCRALRSRSGRAP
jgi:hypothetical protein